MRAAVAAGGIATEVWQGMGLTLHMWYMSCLMTGQWCKTMWAVLRCHRPASRIGSRAVALLLFHWPECRCKVSLQCSQMTSCLHARQGCSAITRPVECVQGEAAVQPKDQLNTCKASLQRRQIIICSHARQACSATERPNAYMQGEPAAQLKDQHEHAV